MHSWLFRFFALGCAALGGCATGPPLVTDVTAVVDAPEGLRNRYIEIQGRVIEYEEPQGDRIRTWGFVLEDLAGSRVPVYVEHRAAEDVAAADRLVRRSLREGGPIFALGFLRTGRYGSRSGGPRLDLRMVQYREDVARLAPRDRYDDPYASPYRIHFGFGYSRFHHHH